MSFVYVYSEYNTYSVRQTIRHSSDIVSSWSINENTIQHSPNDVNKYFIFETMISTYKRRRVEMIDFREFLRKPSHTKYNVVCFRKCIINNLKNVIKSYCLFRV